MRKPLFDFCHNDFAIPVNDNLAVNTNDDLLMRIGNHMSMDLQSGELHMTSHWSENQENDDNDPFKLHW